MQDPWNDEVYKSEMTVEERRYLKPAETYKRILEDRKNVKQQENSNSKT